MAVVAAVCVCVCVCVGMRLLFREIHTNNASLTRQGSERLLLPFKGKTPDAKRIFAEFGSGQLGLRA